MNKKLLLGCLGVFSVAGLLVACGSGAIDPFGSDDDIAALTLPTSLDAIKSLAACEANAECAAQMDAAVNPPSSAVTPSSSSIHPLSSSLPINPNSSSSLVALSSGVTPISSSSLIVVSSSSVTPEGGIEGTCAPEPAVVELGASVTWTFTKGVSVPVNEIMPASFDWVFEGGSLGEFSGKGVSGISKTTTYNTSGSHAASVSINGTTPTVCAPVQVNGAPITGCECVVDKASPDVAAGGVANWTVAGCASTANITGYTWNGGALGEALTTSHTFAAKDETFTPTLTVSNDDNTVQTVVCPTAKAIDASLPDYEITASGNTAGITFEGNVDATIVMNLPETWHGETAGTCSFACQVNRSGGSGAISGTVDEVDITGSDYVTAEIPITSTISGYALKLVVDVGTNAGVTCFVNW